MNSRARSGFELAKSELSTVDSSNDSSFSVFVNSTILSTETIADSTMVEFFTPHCKAPAKPRPIVSMKPATAEEMVPGKK